MILSYYMAPRLILLCKRNIQTLVAINYNLLIVEFESKNSLHSRETRSQDCARARFVYENTWRNGTQREWAAAAAACDIINIKKRTRIKHTNIRNILYSHARARACPHKTSHAALGLLVWHGVRARARIIYTRVARQCL